MTENTSGSGTVSERISVTIEQGIPSMMKAIVAENIRLREENKKLKWELLMVSKLASDDAQFYNPLNAMLAAGIRDRAIEDGL